MNAPTVRQPTELAVINTPYALMESAVANGSNVETLEKLMMLQERYEANEAKKAFYTAMQQFQSVKPELKRSSNVNFNTNKGTTDYNFCALPDIEKALKEPLTKCGLSYRFENLNKPVQVEEKTVLLTGIKCIVSHVSGHSESTEMFAPADASGNKNAIQAIGSTSTYLMRYSLIAAFALTTADEDNDGKDNSDLPFARVLQQNELLRDANILRAVLDIKDCLEQDDFDTVVGYLAAMPEATQSALWIAPSKGGIFTTEERNKMRSNEFGAARAAYHTALKEESANG